MNEKPNCFQKKGVASAFLDLPSPKHTSETVTVTRMKVTRNPYPVFHPKPASAMQSPIIIFRASKKRASLPNK